nr:MAG: capsid protein [Chemarfal virus 119]
MARKYRGRKRAAARRGLKHRGSSRPGAAMSYRRGMVPGVHRFKEAVQIASVSALANNVGYGVMNWKIGDLTNFASFQGLFDLYKLTGVKIKMIPRFNQSQAGTPGIGGTQAGQLPILYIAPNHDPYVPPPSNIPDIINDDGVKIIQVSRPLSFYINNPKPDLRTAGGDALGLQFNSRRKALQPWLTTGGNLQTVDQSLTKHYGFRWALENTPLQYDCVLDVYATYYFSMKEQD